MLPLTPHANKLQREISQGASNIPETPKSAQSKGIGTPGTRKALADVSNSRSITNSQSLFGAELRGRSLFGSTPSSFIPVDTDADAGAAGSAFGTSQRLARDPQTPSKTSKLLEVFDEDPEITGLELPEIDRFCEPSDELNDSYFNATGCGNIGDPEKLLSSLVRDNAEVLRNEHAKDALAWGLPTDADMMAVDEAPQGLWSPPPPAPVPHQVRQIQLSPFRLDLPPMILDSDMGMDFDMRM